MRGTFLIVLGLCIALAGCPNVAEQKTGTVTVRVTDHRAGINDFSTLYVQFAEISVHRRESSRWTGWIELLRNSPAVDIVPLKDGRWATVGTTQVQIGHYDAIRVRFGDAQGTLLTGGPVTMASVGTTIAVDLAVQPDTSRAVLIDLYVEDQTDDQPGLYAIKVHDITVGRDRENR